MLTKITDEFYVDLDQICSYIGSQEYDSYLIYLRNGQRLDIDPESARNLLKILNKKNTDHQINKSNLNAMFCRY